MAKPANGVSQDRKALVLRPIADEISASRVILR